MKTHALSNRLFNPLFQCWHHTVPQGWFGLTSISLFSCIRVASRIKKTVYQKSLKGRMCFKSNIKWWYCDRMEIGNMTLLRFFSLSRGSDKIINKWKKTAGKCRKWERETRQGQNGIYSVRCLGDRWHINNIHYSLLVFCCILFHIFYNLIQ